MGIGPICIPETTGDDVEYKGRSASVAGWGELYYGTCQIQRFNTGLIKVQYTVSTYKIQKVSNGRWKKLGISESTFRNLCDEDQTYICIHSGPRQLRSARSDNPDPVIGDLQGIL